MGLDMYLHAKRFYWFNEEKPKVLQVPEGYEVQEVSVRVAYWRKANQVHAWFVENVQDDTDDCREYSVYRDKIRELIQICKTILADRSLAPEMLPTQEGFFFGSTEYDEWYFKDIEETIEQLEPLLDEEKFPEKDWDFYYHSSW